MVLAITGLLVVAVAMEAVEEEEEEESELVEVMEEVELEREWRDVLERGVSHSGELGQELCGEVGGVGRRGGRSAVVNFMT